MKLRIEKMYETFDHTADLGLRIRAADLNTLFTEAGIALESAMVEELASIAPVRRVDLHLPTDDLEYLLFDWLKGLLALFDIEKMLFSRFEVTVGQSGLDAAVWGEPFDPARHQATHEIKAITYHALRVEQTPEGWLAEVIVDI